MTCVVIGCSDYAALGAHVVEAHRRATTESHWWIVGMCWGCNSRFKGEVFPIDERTGWAEHTYLDTCVGFGEAE